MGILGVLLCQCHIALWTDLWININRNISWFSSSVSRNEVTLLWYLPPTAFTLYHSKSHSPRRWYSVVELNNLQIFSVFSVCCDFLMTGVARPCTISVNALRCASEDVDAIPKNHAMKLHKETGGTAPRILKVSGTWYSWEESLWAPPDFTAPFLLTGTQPFDRTAVSHFVDWVTGSYLGLWITEATSRQGYVPSASWLPPPPTEYTTQNFYRWYHSNKNIV